jgi:hypothetical protein
VHRLREVDVHLGAARCRAGRSPGSFSQTFVPLSLLVVKSPWRQIAVAHFASGAPFFRRRAGSRQEVAPPQAEHSNSRNPGSSPNGAILPTSCMDWPHFGQSGAAGSIGARAMIRPFRVDRGRHSTSSPLDQRHDRETVPGYPDRQSSAPDLLDDMSENAKPATRFSGAASSKPHLNAHPMIWDVSGTHRAADPVARRARRIVALPVRAALAKAGRDSRRQPLKALA